MTETNPVDLTPATEPAGVSLTDLVDDAPDVEILRDDNPQPNGLVTPAEASPPATGAAQPTGNTSTTTPPDFITGYADYADVFEIPRKAHEWAAIQLIASLLNAKVPILNGGQTLTLDLWIMLLSASGVGRNTVLDVAQDVVDRSGIRGLIRDAMWGSVPAFYQQLAESPRGLYAWPEWSVVGRTLNDPRFGGVKEWLTNRYDNQRTPESIVYRITGKKSDTPPIVFTTAPRINILASSSEDWFVSSLDQADVTGGFIPRFVLVRLPQSSRLIPKPQALDSTRIGPLTQQLQAISQLQGNPTFTLEAEGLYEQWYGDAHKRFEGQPNPALAKPFFRRLRGQVLKLAVIFEVSQSGSLNVSKGAMQRAIDTGLDIERTIFDILPTGMNREGSEVQRMEKLIHDAGAAGILHSMLTLAFKHWKKREREERLCTLIESGTVCVFFRQTTGRRARVYVHRDHLKAHKKKRKRDVPCS